jgi:ribosomal protein L14E/L6E/L27E
MSEKSLQVGRLVCSVKGRDSGRFYLIVEIENQAGVWVADGEGRKIEKPKKKNVKHLKFYDIMAPAVVEKVQRGRRITNEDVRNELKSIIKKSL